MCERRELMEWTLEDVCWNRGRMLDSTRCYGGTPNWCNIQSILIATAGRYCESYASDILLSIDEIKRALDSGIDTCVPIGFREMGVDHKTFIVSRMDEMSDTVGMYYRKIFTVNVTFQDGDTSIVLKDISNEIGSAASRSLSRIRKTAAC